MAGRKRHSAEDIVRKLRHADESAAEGNSTGYSPKSSSTPTPGPQRPNESKHSRSGTSTSTTIDHTPPPKASHQHHDSPPASPTWCPPTPNGASPQPDEACRWWR